MLDVPIVNFRDLGESLSVLEGKEKLPAERIFRGGRLINVFSHKEMLSIPSVVSVRKSPDSPEFPCSYYHVPIEDSVEVYNAQDARVRRWITSFIELLLTPGFQFPVLIHCTSGKDRTGVICAILGKISGFSNQTIVDEYSLSDGEIYPELIAEFLEQAGDLESYLPMSNLAELRKLISSK